ncbi:RDD family protein [Granulicoccus phenolivorans]|uniref:RDD family protein n=1 Tax=Granulicoccus phenolivorans TaxID=266854 RepID=UPI0004033D3F|nr:RDD family protein [Granulicoccus phenolivorans]
MTESYAPAPGTPAPGNSGIPAAEGPTAEPAGLGLRFLAAVVDSIVPLVVVAAYGLGLTVITNANVLLVVTVLAGLILLGWAGFVWWSGAERAATPGMRVLGLEIVGIRDGRQIGWGRFAARQLAAGVLAALIVPYILMLVWLVIDDQYRGWHDRAAGAIVVSQRPVARERPMAPQPRPRARTVGLPAHLTAAAGTPPPPAQPAPPVSAQPAPPVSTPSPRPVSTPDDPDATSVAPPGSRHTPPTVRSAPEVGWVIALADGRRLPVRPAVLLGRNPEPRPGEPAAPVRVDDATRTVSKTHLLVALDRDGVFVMDCGSTNGSGVEEPGGRFRRLNPGEAARVGEGQRVSFGDHVLQLLRE